MEKKHSVRPTSGPPTPSIFSDADSNSFPATGLSCSHRLTYAIFRTLASIENVTYSKGPSTGAFSGGPVLNEKGRDIGTFKGQCDGDLLCH